MTERRRSYLVCATQRSGSTLVCELLKGTGVAGRPEEYFEATQQTGIPPHPGEFLEGLERTGLGIRDDPEPPEAPRYSSLAGVADYEQHLERVLELGTTPNGVFGAKLMFNQLTELASLASDVPKYDGLERGELLERLFGSPRYIWVSRGDKVRQAVSMWKALQTRRWRADMSTERPEPEYRYMGIEHLVRRFESEDSGWSKFFATHRIEPLRISYEGDLERDLAGTVQRVLDWLGVSAPAGWRPPEPMDRQSDAGSEDWVAAYHRDRAASRRGAVTLRSSC